MNTDTAPPLIYVIRFLLTLMDIKDRLHFNHNDHFRLILREIFLPTSLGQKVQFLTKEWFSLIFRLGLLAAFVDFFYNFGCNNI